MNPRNKYLAKLETLIKLVSHAKVVLMSRDVYTIIGLKGATIQTSKGRKKIQLVDGVAVLGVNDGRTKILPLPDEEETDG